MAIIFAAGQVAVTSHVKTEKVSGTCYLGSWRIAVMVTETKHGRPGTAAAMFL